jgi:transposase-like protein
LRDRWYITYRLSYRDLVAMMAERGIVVSHTTILRWVNLYRLTGSRMPTTNRHA